jgi:hypothetical protein
MLERKAQTGHEVFECITWLINGRHMCLQLHVEVIVRIAHEKCLSKFL